MMRRLQTAPITTFRSDPLLGKGFADGIRPLPVDFDGILRSRVVRLLAGLPGVRGAFQAREATIISVKRENASLIGELFLARNPWFVEIVRKRRWPEETTAGGCEATAPFMGVETSVMYLSLAKRLHDFEQAAPAYDAKKYLEIGGGFGAIAHLLLTWRTELRKVVLVDIAPVIYIATQYLKAHFGSAVRDYKELRGGAISLLDDDSPEIICIPTWAIERFTGSIDLFHNAASFSEMTPEIVQNYAAHWRRLAHSQSVFWLFLNKTTEHANVELALPSAIRESFDWLSFEQIAQDRPGVTLVSTPPPIAQTKPNRPSAGHARADRRER